MIKMTEPERSNYKFVRHMEEGDRESVREYRDWLKITKQFNHQNPDFLAIRREDLIADINFLLCSYECENKQDAEVSLKLFLERVGVLDDCIIVLDKDNCKLRLYMEDKKNA